LFTARTLVHNHRETVRIEISEQGDGAFAVVDIDTLWRDNATGFEDHWLGRTCKLYAPNGTGLATLLATLSTLNNSQE
jgi:hypothetical protein